MAWRYMLASQHGRTDPSPEAWLGRRRTRSRHPTTVMVVRCMHGRIDIPFTTAAPRGIAHA